MKTIAIPTLIALCVIASGCSSDTMARMNMKHPSAVERIAYTSPAPEPTLASGAVDELEPVAQGPVASPAWGSGFTPF